jgi:hypothetical protein
VSSESVKAKSRAARQFAHGAEFEEPIEQPARSAVREPRRPRRAGQRNGVVGEQQLDDAAAALGAEFRRDRQRPVQRRAPTRPAPPARRRRPARPANPDRSAAGVGAGRHAAPAAYASWRRARPAAPTLGARRARHRPPIRRGFPPRRAVSSAPSHQHDASRRPCGERLIVTRESALQRAGERRLPEIGGNRRAWRRLRVRRRPTSPVGPATARHNLRTRSAGLVSSAPEAWGSASRKAASSSRERNAVAARSARGRNASAKLTSLAGLTSIPNGCSELCRSLHRRPRTFPQRDRRTTARRSRWRHAIGRHMRRNQRGREAPCRVREQSAVT